MRSLLAALVALGIGGCSLIVSDIELPAEGQVGDAAAELDEGAVDEGALPDAWRPDAQPPPDAWTPPDAVARDAGPDTSWTPDAAPDVGPPPADAAPDAAWTPDAEPPPVVVDLSALAGEWHLYGVMPSANGPVAFEGVLVVRAVGTAHIEDFGGNVLHDDTPFLVDEQAPERVEAVLFPLAGRVTGVLDPHSGFGVLVNDGQSGNRVPTFVLLARRDDPPAALPSTTLYAHNRVLVYLGQGEIGGMGNPVADTFSEFDRHPIVAGAPTGERIFTRRADRRGRNRLEPADDVPDGRLYSVIPGGDGAIGVTSEAGQHDGLAVAWSASTAALPRAAAPYFCAGMLLDEAQPRPTLATRAAGADLDGTGIRWADGRSARFDVRGNLLGLTTREGFFGGSDELGLLEGTGRALIVLPVAFGREVAVRWGIAACVASAPPR